MEELGVLVKDINARLSSINDRFTKLENKEENIEDAINAPMYFISSEGGTQLVCAIKEFSLLGINVFIHDRYGAYSLTDKLVGLSICATSSSICELIRMGKSKIHTMGVKAYLKSRNKYPIVNPLKSEKNNLKTKKIMGTKERTAISKMTSPTVADTIQELDVALEKYFIVDKKVKKSEYKIMAKMIAGILINEMPQRFADAIIKYNIEQIEKAKQNLKMENETINKKKII